MTSNRGKTGIRGAVECDADVSTTFRRLMWSITEHGVMELILFYAIKKRNVVDDDVIYALVHH